MRSKTAFSLASLMLVPAGAYALGLGPIQLNSALNQPFNAKIRLLGASKDELSELKVGLADAKAFHKAGIERPFSLAKLRFKVVGSANGRDYIDVTSHDPIQEPFLDFLLELNWNKGRLYREYTVLLDPPHYGTSGAATASTATAPAATTAPVAPAPESAPAAGAPSTSQGAASGAAAQAASTYTGGDTYGPTSATDTLWSIAQAVRPDASVTVQQMMLALLKANPDAFNEDNVNALKKGAILHIPAKSAAQSVDPAAALAEVRKQYGLWDQYRQKLAATPAERPSGAATSSGTQAAAQGAQEASTGGAHLKLVPPEQAGGSKAGSPAASGTAGSSLQSLQDQLAVLNESVETQKQQNADLQSRLSEAQQLIGSLRHLIALKDDQLAALQAKVSNLGAAPKAASAAAQPAAGQAKPAPSAETAAAPAAPAQTEQKAAAPAAVQPKPSAAAKPAAPSETAPKAKMEQPPAAAHAPPETMLDRANDIVRSFVPKSVLDMLPGGALTALGIIVLVVLVLIALVGRLVRARREKSNTEAMAAAMAPPVSPPEPSEDTTGLASEAPTERPGHDAEDEDETVTALAGPEEEEPATEIISPDEAVPAAFEEPEEDPLAEVNVYLAYERFDQAEELVKQAIAREPAQAKYRLRLLEVYYSANDKAKYEAAARELHDAVGGEGPLWDSALAMWHELSPDRALFEAGEAEAPEPEEAARGAKQFVDITSDEAGLAGEAQGGEFTETVQTKADSDNSLDFEFPGGEAASGPGAQEEPGALDITASAAGPEETEESPEPEEGIIDLTAPGSEAADEDVLDITAGESARDEDLLDVTVTGQGLSVEESDSMLDVTATGGREELDEDLLDITGGQGTSTDEESTEVLDLTAGGEEQDAGAAPSETSMDDEHVLEFDVGGAPGALSAEEGTEPREEQEAEPPAVGEGGSEEAAADENLLEFDLGGSGEEEGGEFLDITSGGQEETPTGEPGDENVLEFDVSGLSTGEEPEAAGSEEEGVFDLGEEEAGDSSLEIDLSDFGDLETEGTEELGQLGGTADQPEAGEPEGERTGGRESEASDAVPDLRIEEEDEDDDATQLFLDDAGTPTLDISDLTVGEGAGGDASTESREAESKADEFDLDLDIETPEDAGEHEHLTTVEFEPQPPAEEGEAGEDTVVMPRRPDAEEQSEEDEVDTKLNLAKAYIELGDSEGARAILDEVANEGTDEQRREASELRQQLDS